MSLVILFVLLLLLSFGAIVLVLKPGKTEADVQRHLSDMGDVFTAVDAGGNTILRRESLSSIPWLNSLLQQVPGSLSLRLLITQAGSRWALSTLLFGSVLAALATAWIVSLFMPAVLLDLLVGVAVGVMPYLYLLAKRSARFQRFDKLLPEAIDLMSRALKAGHAVTSALEMVAQEIGDPVSGEFRIVFDEQNLGLPMREALLNLAQRLPLEDVRFVATAILVQRESGGNLAEVLDKTAGVMRDRIRLRGQLRIYTAQGRLTGWILCAMPFIIFGLVSMANYDYEKKLWTDPLGLHLVYTGLVMMAVGVLAIRKIVDIRV
ncbi:MAG TPA: type II secretion system F family protein [Terriglobia bacterium]|jgi:tight adherence protein B|nr:type II secretion system F family protein [Terriglobia bacterium]